MRFRACMPAGCFVSVTFDAPTLVALRTATVLKVKAAADGGAAAPFSILRHGFATALDRVGGAVALTAGATAKRERGIFRPRPKPAGPPTAPPRFSASQKTGSQACSSQSHVFAASSASAREDLGKLPIRWTDA